MEYLNEIISRKGKMNFAKARKEAEKNCIKREIFGNSLSGLEETTFYFADGSKITFVDIKKKNSKIVKL